jgi:hypothetical protein
VYVIISSNIFWTTFMPLTLNSTPSCLTFLSFFELLQLL